MKRIRATSIKKALLGGCLLLGMGVTSGAALAAPVLRVLVVDTRDMKAYLRELETLRNEYKKAGVALQLRVWRATFAGADAGTVVVTLETSDLATFAKVIDLQKSDAEIAATMQRIGALRHIDSDSLYEEEGP